jgi:glycerol uptake facilitator-like aquaporin
MGVSSEEAPLPLLRRGFAELIGTLLFVLFVGLGGAAGVLRPLVPALALMSIKFSLGHVSLGSVNPGNSLGLFLRGVLTWRATIVYVVAELLGGGLGAALAVAFVPVERAVIPAVTASVWVGFLAEVVGGFALVFVSLNNTSADVEGNSFYGLSAGAMLGAVVLVFDPVSGACVNPAIGMLSLVAPLYGRSVPASAWVKGPVDHRDGSAPHSSSFSEAALNFN